MNTVNSVQVGAGSLPSARPFPVRTIAKRIALVLGALVGLVILGVVGLYLSAEYRMAKSYAIPVESVTVPTNAQALERGQHWAALLCTDCHGDNLAGKVILDDPDLGRIEGDNLTPGKGGLGAVYGEADWIRAIRHGVGRDGRALLGMPSADWYNQSDQDVGELVAYLKTLPPVDAVTMGPSLTPLGKVLMGAGVMHDVLQAEGIDHTAPRSSAPAPSVSAAYGEYLARATGCRTCHGADLAGGTSPDPKSPPAPDLTQRGALRSWSEQVFISQARVRVSPFMTWSVLNRMTDDELRAVWLYLKSLSGK